MWTITTFLEQLLRTLTSLAEVWRKQWSSCSVSGPRVSEGTLCLWCSPCPVWCDSDGCGGKKKRSERVGVAFKTKSFSKLNSRSMTQNSEGSKADSFPVKSQKAKEDHVHNHLFATDRNFTKAGTFTATVEGSSVFVWHLPRLHIYCSNWNIKSFGQIWTLMLQCGGKSKIQKQMQKLHNTPNKPLTYMMRLQ